MPDWIYCYLFLPWEDHSSSGPSSKYHPRIVLILSQLIPVLAFKSPYRVTSTSGSSQASLHPNAEHTGLYRLSTMNSLHDRKPSLFANGTYSKHSRRGFHFIHFTSVQSRNTKKGYLAHKVQIQNCFCDYCMCKSGHKALLNICIIVLDYVCFKEGDLLSRC